MEDDNVHVDDSDGPAGREPSDPPRTWWLPAATVVGLIFAVIVLVATQRPTDELSDNTPEASPALTTTTAPSTTTAAAATTTTTVWWGATEAAAEFQAVVQDVCERASLVGADGMQPVDEGWVESLFIDGEWMYYSVERVVFEMAQARNAQNEELVGLLEGVADHLEDAEAATDFVLRHTAPVGSDEWTYQVLLGERHCAAAAATITTMVATPATAATSTLWWDATRPGNIESDLQSLCLLASPTGPEALNTIEASFEATYGGNWWTAYNRVSLRVDDDANPARLAQDIPLVHMLASVATDLDKLEAAVENAYRYNTDLDPDVWAYHALFIERHCASATATIGTMAAIINQ